MQKSKSRVFKKNFRIDDKKDEKSGGKKKPDNLKEIQVKLGQNQGTLTIGPGLVPLA